MRKYSQRSQNKAYELAKRDVGTWEWAEGHNPKVVQYFHDVGHEWVQDDETAWCAAFVGAMLKRAGMPHTGKLNARSYLQWGEPVDPADAQEGDILVFSRGDPNGWQGHVAFNAGRIENGDWRCLGGNQSNQVNVKTYSNSRLLGVRRAPGDVSPSPVVIPKQRSSPVKSKTVQASAAQVASGAAGAASAVAMLDGTAQLVALGFAGVIILLGLWIMRERIKKWAGGDR